MVEAAVGCFSGLWAPNELQTFLVFFLRNSEAKNTPRALHFHGSALLCPEQVLQPSTPHLLDSYTSSDPQSKGHLLQEALLDPPFLVT